MKLLTAWACLTAVASLAGGCSPRQPQHEAEAQTINEIFRLLPIYEAEHSGVRITNLAQVFTNHTGQTDSYPHQWHRRLSVFGKHAGFTNSVYERYVFFPPGTASPRVDGELLFMNARPYPAPHGEMHRMVVSKSTNGFSRRSMNEQVVQKMLLEIGAAEPKPVAMPPPPPTPPELEVREPLLARIRVAFFNFFLINGISGSVAWAVWCAVCSVPIILCVLIGLWIWRQRRH